MELTPELKGHLANDQDFKTELSLEFTIDELDLLNDYLQGGQTGQTELIDRFYEWLEDEFSTPGLNILTIGWDSSGWGPGGSGFISFVSRFGLVRMESSDYEDNELVIFNKSDFFPWGIESLNNDFISIDSEVYGKAEILEIADQMELGDDTLITINGEEIQR